MTDILDLPEGPQALTQHGVERWEDSLVFDSLRYYIPFVGAIPDDAWGDMSFTQGWKAGWKQQVENRSTEATTIRDKMSDIAGGLVSAAADYANTDIDAALDLAEEADAGNGIVHTMLDPLYGNTTIHIGQDGTARPQFSDKAPTFDWPSGDTQNGKRFNYLKYDVNLDKEFATSGSGPMEWQVKLREMPATPGRTEFDKFLKESYPTLLQAEEICGKEGFGLLPDESPSRFVDEALDAWPCVIINRAELMHAVRDNYVDIRDEYQGDVNTLKGKWTSDGGARAYYLLANTTMKYIHDLAAQARWLGQEGRKAGEVVDALLLAYANVGREKIGNIIQLMKDYLDAAEGFTGDVDKPAKLLAQAVKSVAGAMLNSWNYANNQATAESELAKAALAGSNIDTSEHGSVTFPSGGDQSDDWKHGDGWTPGKADSSVPTWETPRLAT